MTQVKLVKFRFKEGGQARWSAWSDELKRRREEVLETLQNEGVLSESCFISEDGKYLYYFMEAEDFDKASQATNDSGYPIDIEHRAMRKLSLERVIELEPLFHFENRHGSQPEPK